MTIDEILFDNINTINHLDIGCSGGFAEMYTKIPENRRTLVGIDASVSEIQRLGKYSNDHFFNYYISSFKNYSPDTNSNYPLHRTLAYLATFKSSMKPISNNSFMIYWHLLNLKKMMKLLDLRAPSNALFDNYHSNEKNANHFYSFHQKRMNALLITDNSRVTEITLDKFKDKHLTKQVDFLKIDVDGSEFDVLTGGESMLEQILAIDIEVQFHGLISEQDDKQFGAIDSFLRARGFSLIDLNIYRYDRWALPGEFIYEGIPAQTKHGPIMWGDAVYIRTKPAPGFPLIWAARWHQNIFIF